MNGLRLVQGVALNFNFKIELSSLNIVKNIATRI